MKLSGSPNKPIYLESGIICSNTQNGRSRRSGHERTMSAPDNVIDYNHSRSASNIGWDATSDLVSVEPGPFPRRDEHVALLLSLVVRRQLATLSTSVPTVIYALRARVGGTS